MRFLRELMGPSLLRALVGRTLLVTVLGLATLAGAAIYGSNELIVGKFRDQASVVSQTATNEIDRQAQRLIQDAALIATLPTVRSLTEARQGGALTAFLSDVRRALSIDFASVTDPKGTVVASARGYPVGTTLPPELLSRAGGDPLTAWVLNDESAGLTIRAIAPVYTQGVTAPIALVEVGYVLGADYLRTVQTSSDTQVALLWEGSIRASTVPLTDLSTFPSLAEIEASTGRVVRDLMIEGRQYEGIFTLVSSPNGTHAIVAVLVPMDELLAAQRALVAVVVVLAVALGAIVSVLALRTARTMIRPLADLAAAAQQIESGGFSVRVPQRSSHEIGTLERAFDTMARSLDERERARREYVEEVGTVNEVAAAIVGVTDRDRIFSESLRRLVRLFGAEGAAIVVRADAPGAPPGSGGRLVAPSVINMDADEVAALAARILVKEVQDPNAIHELQLPNTPVPFVAAIPLSARGRAVGLLIVAFASAHEITESEARGFRTIARLVSVAKENADLVSELRDSNIQLERANRLKSEFLASVSHELRTPMNAIIGYTQLMLDGLAGELTAQQEADLTRVAQAADHLLGLINGILDLAKIEAGKMDLNIETVDLRDVVVDVLELMRPSADEKGLQLTMDVPPETHPAWADSARVRQVLVNLLGNAVKFTDSGGVRVAVTSAEGWLTISVADTGVGMSKDVLSYVFDEFRQADSSTTRRFGGTGLGLAISKRLVALHGGRIWANSAPGEGSTFSFTLPVRVGPASADTSGVAAARS